jgi:hypothetical protein
MTDYFKVQMTCWGVIWQKKISGKNQWKLLKFPLKDKTRHF